MAESKKSIALDLKVLKEPYSITEEVFTVKKRKTVHFPSENLSKGSRSSLFSGPLINYAMLVNKNYPHKTYVRFLERIANIKNIIMEEESNGKVNMQVKQNPFRCFSQHVLFPFSTDNLSLLTNNEAVEEYSVFSCVEFSAHDTTMDDIKPFEVVKYKSERKIEKRPLVKKKELTDKEVEAIIQQKMRKLDEYNTRIEESENKKLLRRYGMDKEKLNRLVKLQSFIRRWIYKKKFFQALRMNEYINHKKNYLKLKKSLDVYEANRSKGSFVSYYSRVSKIFDNLI